MLASVETDKINVEIRAEKSGKIVKYHCAVEQKIDVGASFVDIDTDASGASGSSAPKVEAPSTKQTDTPKQAAKSEAPKQVAKEQPKQEQVSKPSTTPNVQHSRSRQETREPMSRIRQRIADRLKGSQNTYASLTTFNEIDMGNVMEMRKRHQENFTTKHGIKLGFMSFFLKASTIALQEYPIVNSVIDGTEIIHRNYIDISVAVASPKGLVVPVIRDCETRSLANFENELKNLSVKARDNKLSLEDMSGGNFSISNGGVFGSMMGTPIINPPQTAILGMHNTVERPVVRNGQIVARPIMYVALTYDHRLIDGREAVLTLKKIKELIEEPERMLLDA